MSNGEAQPVSMAMQPEEFAELRAAVAEISQSDVRLGRVLEMLTLHLGHAHDLDPVVEDAKLAAAAEEAAKAEAEAAAAEAPVEPAVTFEPAAQEGN